MFRKAGHGSSHNSCGPKITFSWEEVEMTYEIIRRAATTVLLFSTMMPAFAKPGTPATAAGQAQTVSQGTSTKSGGAKAASKNATTQSNASTNPQSANPENNSSNSGSNNPG